MRRGGGLGRRFVRAISENLRGLRVRRLNADCFIVFQTVILKCAPHVTASHNPTADKETPRRLGGRPALDDGQGDCSHVQAVSLQGRTGCVEGALGENVP